MRTLVRWCALSLLVISSGIVQAAEPVLACLSGGGVANTSQAIAKALCWQKNNLSFCGGAFSPIQLSDMSGFDISADEVELSNEGTSVLKGHVLARHHRRQLSAATAHIYKSADQVQRVELLGNVVIAEAEHLIHANYANVHLPDYDGQFKEVLYRLTFTPEDQQLSQQSITVWGKAQHVDRDKQGHLTLSQVTYSACMPTNPSWYLKVKHLELDKQNSEGVAKNAVFYIKKVPVLYLPYLSFPLDTKRKTGFLMPELVINTQNGFAMSLPYYFNLAPNLDLTFTPTFMRKRGTMLGGEFRYLFQRGSGEFEGQWLGRDKSFRSFRLANSGVAPNLLALSDNRYSVKWLHRGELDKNLTLDINYEKVSDDYYLQDFNNNLTLASDNQLLQQVMVKYRLPHWSFKGFLQRYQTLHPFNQSVVLDVYSRYPSLSAQGTYQLPFNAYSQTLLQLDRFDWHGLNPQTMPVGYRYRARSKLGIRQSNMGYFINPQLAVDYAYYDLARYNNRNKHISRVIPTISLDSGLFLEKQYGDSWLNSIEPRLYYLYVPYVRQFQIPIFDTAYYFPTYNQLFRDNRFVGGDRVGDANQLSFGITSRFIEQRLGLERLRISLGGGYAFRSRRVFLCQNFVGISCQDNVNRLAFTSFQAGWRPLQLETDLSLNRKWGLLTGTSYDIQTKQFNSILVDFNYKPRVNHIINVGYGFVLNGDPTLLNRRVRTNTNLHQIRLSYAWPLKGHWKSLGAWSYNLSHGFSMSYLLGLQYEDCCVSARVLGGRVYQNYTQQGKPRYSHNLYLQILFKGLGSGGNNDPGNIIRSFLPSYRDEFKMRVN